eukprot:358752-Chlamydomonas_euryale.AAC.12
MESLRESFPVHGNSRDLGRLKMEIIREALASAQYVCMGLKHRMYGCNVWLQYVAACPYHEELNVDTVGLPNAVHTVFCLLNLAWHPCQLSKEDCRRRSQRETCTCCPNAEHSNLHATADKLKSWPFLRASAIQQSSLHTPF